MRDEEAVKAASARFYEALSQLVRGNAAPMRDVWHTSPQVTTAHPMGDWFVGSEQVQASWDEIARMNEGGQGTFSVRGEKTFVYGDIAYVIGTEQSHLKVGDKETRWTANFTNIFHRVDGVWKMVHHHADKNNAAEKLIDELAG